MALASHSQALNKKLKLGMVINILFTVFEFAVGITSGSLALISDATHNLTDVLSIFISFVGNTLAQRKSTERHTYGYGRASIIAALLNGIILFSLSFYILHAAYNRFYNPEQVEGGIVMLVGFLGICVNGGVALLFLKDRDDLNVRSSLLNMFFDALASAAALIAGIIIKYTGYTSIDALASGFTGVLLLVSASVILFRVVHILVQGVPQHLDITTIKNYLSSFPEVTAVHDLHVWALSSRETVLTCHLVIVNTNLAHIKTQLAAIKFGLETNFDIRHTTIEVESVPCTTQSDSY
ncbi:cation transporter [Candidatus Dependentiae bacterium]|nr:cation transporter [Candidatus Dependentiae bacterium]